MDVVDDEQSGRQDDGQRGDLRSPLGLQRRRVDEHLQGVNQEKLRDDDREPLEVDRLPAIISKIVYPHHGRIYQASDVGEQPLKVGEEGRIVESPF